MPLYNTLRSFYQEYEMPLQAAFFDIEKRGILVDTPRLAAVRSHVISELDIASSEIQKRTGKRVVVYADDRVNDGDVALNSTKDLKVLLKSLGLKLPLNRYTHQETTNDEALNDLFARTGNEVLRLVLRVRELGKIKGTYVDATLLNNILYCSYIVAGTVSGRRSSRKSFLDIGTNGQNLPKHSIIGKLYRRCLIARPGHIILSCDQRGAEDWIVQAIIADNGGSHKGLQELQAGINRHRRLASFLFGRPESDCSKETIFYFLGKKTRHAGNYDMRKDTMASSLAGEGIGVSSGQQFSPERLVQTCDYLLGRFHQFEPDIRGVFHKYVKDTLESTHELVTPIGRRRVFFALRSYSDNNKVFREGYSQIPQGTVGDNTGLAILGLESGRGDTPNARLDQHQAQVIADGHDAVYLEVVDSGRAVAHAITQLAASFRRTLRFPNGVEIEIPVEYEVGYNMAPCDPRCEVFPDGNPDGLRSFDTLEQGLEVYKDLRRIREATQQVVDTSLDRPYAASIGSA